MVSNIIYSSINPSVVFRVELENKIKGPDNPTSQLLPIMNHKSCRGDGEGRKDKGCDGGSTRKKLYMTKSYMKDVVWQREMVCVWQSCVWKMVCVCESCVWKRACEMLCARCVCVCFFLRSFSDQKSARAASSDLMTALCQGSWEKETKAPACSAQKLDRQHESEPSFTAALISLWGCPGAGSQPMMASGAIVWDVGWNWLRWLEWRNNSVFVFFGFVIVGLTPLGPFFFNCRGWVHFGFRRACKRASTGELMWYHPWKTNLWIGLALASPGHWQNDALGAQVGTSVWWTLHKQ